MIQKYNQELNIDEAVDTIMKDVLSDKRRGLIDGAEQL